MASNAKELLETALALPAIDRAAIVESLLLSLDQPDITLDACWATEAEARLSMYDACHTKAIPVDGVFRELAVL
jgi:putative addiction module component (TIGR02574 family)